mgnify:CR=1 FL=1
MSHPSVYPVPASAAKRSLLTNEQYMQMYQQSVSSPDTFWAEHGKRLHWFTDFSKVKSTSFESGQVGINWFSDGVLNASYNCLDRHLPERANQVAYYWEGDSPDVQKTVTYGQLHQQVCKLANGMKALGVEKGDRVTIYLPMIPEAAVALLACARIGAVHSVVFAGFSPDALGSRIVDCDSKLVITADQALRGSRVTNLKDNTDMALAHLGSDSPVQNVIVVKHVGKNVDMNAGKDGRDLWYHELLSQHSSDCPAEPMNAEDPLFILYTSGSTGKPKGAANRHLSLTSCMQWMQDSYGLTTADTVLHKAAFGFDVSVWELFWPLTAGARLALARPGDHRDPSRIIELIRQHRVTTLNFVPVMLQAFLAQEGIEHQTNLRFIICGGEAMPAATQAEALARLQGASLQNLYGPTEAAIHVTRWTCRADGKSQVPIGRPISATQTWVLDRNLNPVPPGVAGELYLGGTHLGRGYLNRPSLTAERFIANPQSNTGERLYRTGDLVRWNDEGQLEYLGRIDHQVKIRGFRIELGEVEAQLLAQPEVSDAVVIAQQGPAGARLVGYVALHNGRLIDSAGLRERLGALDAAMMARRDFWLAQADWDALLAGADVEPASPGATGDNNKRAAAGGH